MSAKPGTLTGEQFRRLLDKLVTDVPLMMRKREVFHVDCENQKTSFESLVCMLTYTHARHTHTTCQWLKLFALL